MTRLHRTLLARIDKAVYEYRMFQDGDGVLFAVSGGIDSMALVDLLADHLVVYGQDMRVKAVYVDLGFGVHADERCRKMSDFFASRRVEGEIVRTEIGPYAHSDENRENPCFLCSRIRRRHIFEAAERLGCQKIVFGHHKDDIIETLLLNMIYSREISTMPPRLEVFQGKYTILRPMMYIEKELVEKFARERGLVPIDQECPTAGNSKRQYIKELLAALEAEVPGAKENIFAAMKRVKTDYLLAPAATLAKELQR
ncbi:MAG: tRNA 2-thiocytidine(32) synthetase TtcA [candidate division KSB1 bacterium]|nr:tRNA 2-thiocytidine(32) synthetase TtcA [candidate division KSB1 bacterium]